MSHLVSMVQKWKRESKALLTTNQCAELRLIQPLHQFQLEACWGSPALGQMPPLGLSWDL